MIVGGGIERVDQKALRDAKNNGAREKGEGGIGGHHLLAHPRRDRRRRVGGRRRNGSRDGGTDQEEVQMEEVISTKPETPIPTKPKIPENPWMKDITQPIGAPITGEMGKMKESPKDNKPGSSGDKRMAEAAPMAIPKKKTKVEGQWKWYPKEKPNKGHYQTGKSNSKGRGPKGKGNHQESEEEEDRYGHILKNGKRAPWDFLLDREIKLEVVAKPPPPKLSSVRDERQKVGLTNAEIDRITKMMAEEDDAGGDDEEGVEPFLNYGKMGC